MKSGKLFVWPFVWVLSMLIFQGLKKCFSFIESSYRKHSRRLNAEKSSNKFHSNKIWPGLSITLYSFYQQSCHPVLAS